MADPNANMTQSTPQEILISVVAGLIAPLLAIFLVVQLILGIQNKQVDTDTSEAANKAVTSRIQPFAKLEALDASAPKVEQSGEQVFGAACTACHTPGALGAPKLNAKADWGSRLGQGYDTLVKHAIEGIRQMPPRGGNPDLSDVEIARAVAYMANSGGANFKAPEAAAPAAVPATATTSDSKTAVAAPAVVAATSAANPAAASGKGEAVYKQACLMCHASGAAGAPKLDDKAAWGPRIAKGKDALYTSALKGKNAMPAKGGNASLSDADVKATVDYMVGKAK